MSELDATHPLDAACLAIAPFQAMSRILYDDIPDEEVLKMPVTAGQIRAARAAYLKMQEWNSRIADLVKKDGAEALADLRRELLGLKLP